MNCFRVPSLPRPPMPTPREMPETNGRQTLPLVLSTLAVVHTNLRAWLQSADYHMSSRRCSPQVAVAISRGKGRLASALMCLLGERPRGPCHVEKPKTTNHVRKNNSHSLCTYIRSILPHLAASLQQMTSQCSCSIIFSEEIQSDKDCWFNGWQDIPRYPGRQRNYVMGGQWARYPGRQVDDEASHRASPGFSLHACAPHGACCLLQKEGWWCTVFQVV